MIRFKKISHRMFAYILTALVLFITFILVVQLFLVEQWYYQRKVDTLQENIQNLSDELVTVYGDYDKTYFLIDQFMEENSAIVNYVSPTEMEMTSVVDACYNPVELLDTVTVTVQGEDGQFYYMPIEGIDSSVTLDFAIGDKLDVEGTVTEDSLLPKQINELELIGIDGVTGEDFTGSVVVAEIFDGSDMTYDFAYSMFEKIDENYIEKGFSYFTIQQPFSQVESIIFTKEILLDSGGELVLYVESSLQSVSEVMAMMKPFYIIFYSVALLIVFILARLLSMRMAKPIVEITEKANQMSLLNFTQKIDNDDVDELGQLARSFNSLSDSLSATMSELKEANKVLLDDIEKERKMKADQKDFVANVSHELKTPIGIARGYIEAIKDGIRKDRHDEYLEITLKELRRMNDTVVNMLQLMKYEEAKKALSYECVTMDPIVVEIRAYFEVLMTSKNMTIDIATLPESAWIERSTFRTLMMNLISNAIKYGDDGSTITVTSSEVERGYAIYVRNRVADPAQIDLEKIWYKFYTADRSHNSNLSGTGLGLSIVRSVLDRYNSEYEAYIEADEFVFKFTLVDRA